MTNPDLTLLRARFPAEDIEWRIGQAGKSRQGKLWATVFPYITARAVQDRLDEVVGPGNWKIEFRAFQVGEKTGVLAGLSIKLGDEWVTKWDGAEPTATEPFKGGLSDAVKRAAAVWGIGRYLYSMPVCWADINDNGQYRASAKVNDERINFKWDPPELPGR